MEASMGYIVAWAIAVVIAWMIGTARGREAAGFFLGVFFGPLGTIAALFLKPNAKKVEAAALSSGELKKCPYCAELIKKEAVVCKHCGRDL